MTQLADAEQDTPPHGGPGPDEAPGVLSPQRLTAAAAATGQAAARARETTARGSRILPAAATGAVAGAGLLLYAGSTGHLPAALQDKALAGASIPALAIAAGAGAVAGAALARGWCLLSRRKIDDIAMFLAAGLATVVAMTGMWVFFGQVLHYSGPLRAFLFAFLELAVVTEAQRAYKAVRADRGPGVDGMAVWFLAALSGVLSALAAKTLAEFMFRLAAPLVAAWLWHRGMQIERRERAGRRIHWRVTPERILVRLGLAEPVGRTAGDVDAHRRLHRLALAAKHRGDLEAAGARPGRQRIAARRLDTAMADAIAHASLATSPEQMDSLLRQLGALRNTAQLAALAPPPPWADHPRAIQGPPPGNPDGQRRPRRRRPRSEDTTIPSDFGELADAITGALHQGDVQLAHETLSALAEPAYDAFARWLGRSQKRGAKRLLALVAAYATGSVEDRAAARDWIAIRVPSPAGGVDKAELRRQAQLVAPYWPRGPLAADPGQDAGDHDDTGDEDDETEGSGLGAGPAPQARADDREDTDPAHETGA